MSEINPENELVQKLHDHWHKIAALLIFKFKQAEIVITEEDVLAFNEQHPDSAVLCHDKKDGLHLMLVTMEQGKALAAQEARMFPGCDCHACGRGHLIEEVKGAGWWQCDHCNWKGRK
jgi:hypothetical protein